MGSRGRTILHRLYLSALGLLLFLGISTVAVALGSRAHDEQVEEEDLRCLQRESAAEEEKERKLAAEHPEWDGFVPEEAADAILERCHISFWDKVPHSNRRWHFLEPEWSPLALLPALLIWMLAAWVRWVFKPSE